MRIHLLRVGAISFALAWSTISIPGAENQLLYLDANQPIESRVKDLLSRLTLEEKISIIHADSKFTTPTIPRLGIPRRWLDDGRRDFVHRPLCRRRCRARSMRGR
jgi:beta-glucosidase